MKTPRAIFIVLLAGILATQAGARVHDKVLYPRLSHSGSITAAGFSQEQNRLITAGTDGSLRIWNTDTMSLFRAHSISAHSITHLSVHPTKTRVAVVESPSSASPRISVWDWISGARLFSVEADATPLSMSYSPSGSFLMYSIERPDALVMISAEDGSSMPHGVTRTGIVSYFTIAASENTVMLYSPGNGRISYRSIRDGAVVQSVTALSGLELLQVLPNRRFAAAKSGDELVLLDIVSGRLVDRVGVSGIRSLSIDPLSGDIGVIQRQNSRYYYRTWQLEQNRLAERTFALRELTREPTLSISIGGRSVIASRDGTLSYYFAHSRYSRTLARDSRLRIQSIALSDDSLFLQTPDKILNFSGLGISDNAGLGTSLRSLAESAVHLPWEGAFRFRGGADGTLWFQDYGTDSRQLYYLPPQSRGSVSENVLRETMEIGEASILAFQPFGDRILIHGADNTVSIWNPNSRAIEYRHRAPEITAFSYHSDHGLSVGTNAAAGGGRVLVHVNPRTGETVAFSTPSFVISDVAFSDVDGSLYALGLEQGRDGVLYTRLDRWSGAGYNTHETLYRQRGADSTARVVAQPETNRVWVLAGSGTLQLWDDGSLVKIGTEAEFYADLDIQGGLVFVVHRSGALSFYETETATRIMTLYLFRDSQWVAITPDQRFLISAGAVPEDYLVAVTDDGVRRHGLDEYRVRLPLVPVQSELE